MLLHSPLRIQRILVVEPSSIRGLAADFPLLKTLSTYFAIWFYFSLCHLIDFFCFRRIRTYAYFIIAL
nr:MAG TPA: hypothetical protein [Caudoviricetes sp.]